MAPVFKARAALRSEGDACATFLEKIAFASGSSAPPSADVSEIASDRGGPVS